jgi:hypothetical protein
MPLWYAVRYTDYISPLLYDLNSARYFVKKIGTQKKKTLSSESISSASFTVMNMHAARFDTGSGPVYGIEATHWEATYGGASDDFGKHVQQTTDGGFIIAEETKSYGAGWYDVYLIKTDSSGNEQRSQTFGGRNWDRGYSVQQTADGRAVRARTLLLDRHESRSAHLGHDIPMTAPMGDYVYNAYVGHCFIVIINEEHFGFTVTPASRTTGPLEWNTVVDRGFNRDQ